jgi:uncharacterized protein
MLASGALFDLLDPEGSDFTLYDIAHGLGRVCRFAGQTNRFYTVAEHCVHVSRLVLSEAEYLARQGLWHDDIELEFLARAALLHDGAEGFIGDVTRPLKALLPDYKAVEARVELAIANRFLDGRFDLFAHPLIKEFDTAMCLIEARNLMPSAPGYWSALRVPADAWEKAKEVRLHYEKPEYATALWLRHWNRLGHAIEDARATA